MVVSLSLAKWLSSLLTPYVPGTFGFKSPKECVYLLRGWWPPGVRASLALEWSLLEWFVTVDKVYCYLACTSLDIPVLILTGVPSNRVLVDGYLKPSVCVTSWWIKEAKQRINYCLPLLCGCLLNSVKYNKKNWIVTAFTLRKWRRLINLSSCVCGWSLLCHYGQIINNTKFLLIFPRSVDNVNYDKKTVLKFVFQIFSSVAGSQWPKLWWGSECDPPGTLLNTGDPDQPMLIPYLRPFPLSIWVRLALRHLVFSLGPTNRQRNILSLLGPGYILGLYWGPQPGASTHLSHDAIPQHWLY